MPPLLQTRKLLGFRRNLVGMDVKKIVDSSENNTDSHSKKSSKKGGSKRRSTYECRVGALSEDGVLDMYSYHRGREGYEPRDPETGELRCPLEATDTNCNNDAPRLNFNVTIEFPLHDVDQGGSTDDKDFPVYSETLSWDLSDPSTPSPLVVATNIANDFGLKYGQMMDLAISIQSQIDAHTQQNLSYWTPISVADPAGIERHYVGLSVQTHRYGQVVQIAPGGTRLAPKERQRVVAAASRTGSRASSVNGSTTTSARRKSTSSSIKSTKVVQVESTYVDETVDDKYIEAAKRRTRAESVLDIAKKCTNGVLGRMERAENGACHVCRKRTPISFTFACGVASHSYCDAHCKVRSFLLSILTCEIIAHPLKLCVVTQARLEGTFNPEQPVYSFCPICAAICTCAKCVRKLKTLATGLKDAMASQRTTLEDTRYEDLLTKARVLAAKPTSSSSLSGGKRRISEITADEEEDTATRGTTTPKSSTKQAHPKKRANSGPRAERSRLLVPKPPLYEFPREIYVSHELESGTPEDYLRVYTSSGTYLADDFPDVWAEQQDKTVDSDSVPTSNGQLVEDGNVDFCQVCRNHGNLLCCDFCPRAFHVHCIQGDSNATSEERWECIMCKREKDFLPGDLVDTKKSIDLICASFADVKVGDDNGANEIEALSGIHAMVLKLLEYDFGYMFAIRVNVGAIPGYQDIVKKPMDLGTICTKLTSGGYADIMKNGGTFDDVLVAALQDVELVWHNCFLFNFDGSAIYRMAVVQRRRALAIQKRSFDHLLSDRVKIAVNDYVRSCEVARGKLTSASPLGTSAAPDAKEELRSRKPKGKHKITVKVAKPSVNRPIAILDSVTGRIVKIYSSMKSAGHAVHSMISFGHRCEWPATQDLVKTVVLKSSSDPSVLLFGYRWILLEDLRTGRASFHQPPFEGIQVRHGGNTYTYLSLDEAASFPHLDKSQSVEQIWQQLSKLERCNDWTSIAGMMWRRLTPRGQKLPNDPPSQPENKLGLVLVEKPEEDSKFEKKLLAQSAVIKEDLISKRKLVGFQTVESAFKDWMQVATISPSFPPLEPKTMNNFKKYYLDGERNIDCLAWRSQEPTEEEPTSVQNQGLAEPMPTINGVAPSPLVRSVDKRSRDTEPAQTDGNDGATRKESGDTYFTVEPSTGIPRIRDGPNDCETPLPGIQLFKHPPESDQEMKNQNGEGSKGPSDFTVAPA
jgi:hypothetical protein